VVQSPLPIGEAESALKKIFRHRGVDLAQPELGATWDGFKEFAREVPVKAGDDRVLFQIGVYRFAEQERFELSFLRQFMMPEEDPNYDDEPIQLDCRFEYHPAEDLRRLGRFNRWSADEPSLNAFFDAIERTGYLDAASRHEPLTVSITQSQV
jgi:hypothetical protein